MWVGSFSGNLKVSSKRNGGKEEEQKGSWKEQREYEIKESTSESWHECQSFIMKRGIIQSKDK